MRSLHSLQSKYLDSFIDDKKPVMLYFRNGYRIIGIVMGITDEVIFFKHGITEYFYKDDIYSVTPIIQNTA